MEQTKKRPSKAQVLKEHLLSEMREHRIPVGGQLPTETELVRHFSVSRSTVRQVLSELTVAGLIERQQGRGTFRIEGNHQTMPTQRLMLVGVWFNWPAGPLYSEIAQGVRDELSHWGYHAVFEMGGLESGAERQGIEGLVRKQLDGFIVAPSSNPGDEHGPLLSLLERRVPIVLVDRRIGSPPADLVCVDHELGAREVVSHLVRLGHERIGFVGPAGISTIEERFQGYRLTMRQHGLRVDPAWAQMNDQVGVDTGRQAAKALLSMPAGQRPTALFGANDYIAETVAIVARELGLRVPGDVSVVGFDDTNVNPSRPAWLTTYAQPKRRIGQQAARLLMKRIADPQSEVMTLMLQGTLVERQSTGAPS